MSSPSDAVLKELVRLQERYQQAKGRGQQAGEVAFKRLLDFKRKHGLFDEPVFDDDLLESPNADSTN